MKVKLSEGAFAPERAHKEDAGLDLRTPVPFILGAHESYVVDFGVAVEIPVGYYGELMSKSGLNVKHNIQSAGGVIDAGYTGTIRGRILTNNGDYDYEFKRGDKVMQLVVKPCLCCDVNVVDELGDSDRGTDGFGSTGR